MGKPGLRFRVGGHVENVRHGHEAGVGNVIGWSDFIAPKDGAVTAQGDDARTGSEKDFERAVVVYVG